MKRSLLDITRQISRKVGVAYLKPYNLSDTNYWIYVADGFRFVDLLREIEYRSQQDRIKVTINTLYISNRDFIVEELPNALLIKFIKSQFEYQLDELDEIIIKGDIEYYAQ
jgi:transcriptional regulator